MKRLCRDCKTVTECRFAFGRFWTDKSRGGVGCNTPFEPNVAEMARAMTLSARTRENRRPEPTQTEIEF